MKLYDFKAAPNPRRVRIFLAEKGLEVPIVPVNMAEGEHLGDAYRAVLPRCTLPCLELDDGRRIDESISICRYFEALQPEPNLFGRDAWEIAEIDKWLRTLEFDGYINVAHVFRNRVPAFADRALPGYEIPVPQIPALADRGAALVKDWFGKIDSRLGAHDYVAAHRFSVADITLFVALDFSKWVKMFPGAEYPNLLAYHARIAARPSAAA